MPQVTALPILASSPPAAAAGNAPALPGARISASGGGQSGTTAAAGAAQAPDAQDGASPGAARETSGDQSFAAVLGRQMSKDAEADPDPTALAAALAAAAAPASAPLAQPTAAAEKPADPGADAATGVAALLPLLQSLLPGTSFAAVTSDARADTQGNARADSKRDSASLLTAALPTDASALAQTPADPHLAAAAHRAGEDANAQRQDPLLGGDNGGRGRQSPAIPAAAAAVNEVKPIQDKPADLSTTNFASALANAQAPATGHVNHASTPLHVETPVGSRNWDSNVGEKVVWMVGHQEQRAELVLNPPELGKVEVSVSVSGDQASAQFVSANPAVRDALEAAIPRLREMLADAGLNLGQAQVGSDSAQNAAGNPANNRENSDNSRRGSGDVAQVGALRPLGTAGTWLRQGSGMVDVFA